MTFATCTVCGGDQNVMECTRCHAAAYCSKKCQGGDWHLHKLLCKSFTEFMQTRPPVPEGSNTKKYVLGILYPEKEEKPRLHWVPVKWISATERYAGFENYEREPFFGTGLIQAYQVQDNKRTGQPLRSTLVLHFLENFMNDGSVSNQAFAMTTKGQHVWDWRGPLLVTRMAELNVEGAFRDMDLQDFRHITDYLLSYACDRSPSYGASVLGQTNSNISTSMSTTTVPASTESNQQLFNEEKMRAGQSDEKLVVKAKYMDEVTTTPTDTAKMKIEGVKIEATEERGGAASYRAVTLDPDHEIFRPLNPRVSGSEIAARVGLPLLILRYPVTVHSISTANTAATWLHVNTDDKGDGYGWTPMEWQSRVGPILVVREDKVRLTPRQMEIICDFCQHWMGPLFGRSMEDLDPEEPKSREYVLSAMTREKFEQFFFGYRTAKRWIDHIYEYDCRNPYTNLEY